MRTCYVIVHKATQRALPTDTQIAAMGLNVGSFKIEEFELGKKVKWEERRYQEKSGAKTGLAHYLNSRNKVELCSLTADDFELTIRKIGDQAYFDLLGKRGKQAVYEANRKTKKAKKAESADEQTTAEAGNRLTPEKLADLPIEFEWD